MDAARATHMFVFRETTPERYARMSAAERRSALEAWNGWCDRLAAEGRLLEGHPLEDGGRVVGGGGAARSLDGPFAEAKELIGGYFLVHASGLEEATALAAGCPSLRFGLTVEVRTVAPACHLARSLGWETMRGPSAA